MNLFFLLAVKLKKFSVVDIAWPLGFILVVVLHFLSIPASMLNTLVLIIILIWGLRLSSYLTIRSIGKPEDPRYTKLRTEWEPNANQHAYFKVFLLQGCLIYIIALPILFGTHPESRLTFVKLVGLASWLFGFCFESYADYYLNRYKKDLKTKGTICMSGPWSLTRFPNYFGEILSWYGVYLLCFDQYSWWTIIGPLTLNVLILKVTGVAPLEEKYRKNPEYVAYASRVPRLIPFTPPNRLN